MEEDHRGQRDDVTQGVDHAVREVDPLEHRLQQVRHRRLGDRAERQRADGDAELGGGHHLREVFEAVQHLPGPGGAERFDLAAADGDERELGADEETVGEHEQRREDQLEDAHRAASTTFTAGTVLTRRTRSAR